MLRWSLLVLLVSWSRGQLMNRAPQFLPNGDMARFALPEDTPPGSPVYKLQGSDPEGSAVQYSISGEYFTVDTNTGVVTLVKALDRETHDFVTVVISLTDEVLGNTEANTISLRREIPILDVNDNTPTFLNRPYSFRLFENTEPGKQVYHNITVQDKDGGINGDVILSCLPEDAFCKTFDVSTEKISEGNYRGVITLLRPLDFERQRSYSLTIKATDRAKDPAKRLTATANAVIEVDDLQDQPPVFLNIPYSATTPENTEQNTTVLRVGARDGDVGDPRPVRLDILDEFLGCFNLVPVPDAPSTDSGAPVTWYDIVTTDVPLDREHPDILESGGIYSFRIRATELINGELPADFTDTLVTIVVTDTDDQLPAFNQRVFHINVSEEISVDSPLPGLNMMVTDGDIGDNAKYYLSLRDVSNSMGAVAIHPRQGQGHTVIVLRVNDTSRMDFDVADEDAKTIVFDVVAGVKNDYGVVREVASSRVFLHLQDANDNAPEFNNQSFYFSVREDAPPSTLIAPIAATDKDSGLYGQIRYSLKGFGASKFSTDSKTGGVYLGSSHLDYESQTSHTLTLVATDGGNRSTSVSVYIDVLDVNDNKPVFDMKEFSRTIRTKSSAFLPEFFVHAEDADGPEQGGGRVRYEVIEKNFEGNTIDINGETGEVEIHGEISAEHTPKGQYELIVRAWDYGKPSKYEDARVNVRVGHLGNQRPFFRGNAKNSLGIAFYNLTVKETIMPDTDIYRLEAVDPDGATAQLRYYIPLNGKDNFVIGEKTGILATSGVADLDLDRNPTEYKLKVEVVDAGYPLSETGTVQVLVNIEDVNNKPPKFEEDTYTFYFRDDADVNETVGSVKANDPDSNPDIRYSILDPAVYYDKAGLAMKQENVFSINKSGKLILNKSLPPLVNNILLNIQAEDLNSSEGKQNTSVEVLLYVQSRNDVNPVFVDSSWSPKKPILHVNLNEEESKNTLVYTLKAMDPLQAKANFEFQTLKNPYPDTFKVQENGEVILLKRLDFESSETKIFNISVRVLIVEDYLFQVNRPNSRESIVNLQNLPELRYADATLQIELQNINDFAPIFEQNLYRKRVMENIKHPEVILTVKAVDFDNDTILYSISGDSANLFIINSTSGEIRVGEKSSLDREKQNVYKFTVTATDVHVGQVHKTNAQVWIEVLDVNDNPPLFSKKSFSAVIPENVPVGTKILTINASDADLGLSGEVVYQIIEENDAVGLFSIDSETGIVTTSRVLTGRGRADPYNVIVKASDKGDLVLDANGQRGQKSFSSEAALSIYIGDVVRNDGVPVFIKPVPNQRTSVSENASLNTPVFQVIATDPDDPNSAEGQIRYRFLRGNKQDSVPFKINSETGLITTRSSLDREKKSSYLVVIVAHDLGELPQEATRLLQIDVEDVDDHSPLFKRSTNELPMQTHIQEESEIGSEVGLVQCFDEDIGKNALIDYIISDGNPDGLFSIERTEENIGVIRVAGRLDRETTPSHLLTVKCFKKADNGEKLNYLRPYKSQDLSESQVSVILDDIDDNGPVFPTKNITLGVRLNVPPDTRLATLEAVDPDADSPPLHYFIDSVSFHLLGTKSKKPSTKIAVDDIFAINERSGELSTIAPIHKFGDGYFDVLVFANNTEGPGHRGNITARIFVLRDKSLLKLVFNKPPREVTKIVSAVERAVAEALHMPAINIYDTQFFTNTDGSLDFSATSSCFQVIGNRSYTLEELEKLLNVSNNVALDRVFRDFEITGVERCAGRGSKTQVSWVQIWVLVVAAAIGVLALIAAFSVCCCYASYKRAVKRRERAMVPPSTADYMTIRRPGSIAMGIEGSQLTLPNYNKSTRGSQMTLSKGGGASVLLNQPATQMGSQLIINPPKNQPIIMGSQMIAPRATTIRSSGLSEARENLGSQIMYEYVTDGTENLAYEDS